MGRVARKVSHSFMNLEQQIEKEWDEVKDLFKWSDALETAAGERVCMLNISSYLSEHGYPFTAVIDYGSEIAVETYNEKGEWNAGVMHPMNIVLKKPKA
ncbi:MAG: hypothetical protein KJO69_03595 [Gammaproteobacteria bacterium]|nr:hypothetical protein [Gammaproteobacteria bacterium]